MQLAATPVASNTPRTGAVPPVVAKPLLADLRYVGAFSPPAFDLVAAGRPMAVLRSLYDSINPEFPIAFEDMRVPGATAVSDVIAEVAMFGGHASATISVRDATLAFQQIRNRDDFKVCTKIISLCQQALADNLPKTNISSVFLSHTVSLELENSDAEAAEHIARTVPLVGRLAMGELDVGTCRPIPNVEINNETAGWRATLQATPNRDFKAILVVGCTLECDGTKDDSSTAIQRLQRLIQAFLGVLDIQAVNSLHADD